MSTRTRAGVAIGSATLGVGAIAYAIGRGGSGYDGHVEPGRAGGAR